MDFHYPNNFNFVSWQVRLKKMCNLQLNRYFSKDQCPVQVFQSSFLTSKLVCFDVTNFRNNSCDTLVNFEFGILHSEFCAALPWYSVGTRSNKFLQRMSHINITDSLIQIPCIRCSRHSWNTAIFTIPFSNCVNYFWKLSTINLYLTRFSKLQLTHTKYHNKCIKIK